MLYINKIKMEKIKVYSNKEGEKYCKLRVIIDVPVFDWYEDPEGQEVLEIVKKHRNATQR
jgi:hypothetical protein